MSGEIFSNPTFTGLLGGLGVITLQMIWGRVMGNDSKSIPLQLSDMNIRLAAIEATLLLIKNNAEHSGKSHDELKDDFWGHMDKHHVNTAHV